MRKKRGQKPGLRLLRLASVAVIIAMFLGVGIDFLRFPEKYVTTWKYQLQADIKAGDADAVAYYMNTYEKNGVMLFND